MAWIDRVREAAYNSPSGVRLTFDFEDLRKSFDLKTTGFEFPDVDGTYVQSSGVSGRRYPVRVILWGADYDLKAAAFEAALSERGIGTLEHPIDGPVDVVPFGTVTRRDDLKTTANQAVLEVTFWETTGLVYPSAQTDPESDVISALDAFNAAQADQLAGGLSLDTAVERVTTRNRFLSLLNSARSTLQVVAEAEAAAKAQFDTVYDSINLGIDVLISDPLTLAFQTSIFLQAPARAAAAISARLEAYGSLADSLIGANSAEDENDLRTRDYFALNYAAAPVAAVVATQFETRADAISAADAVLAQFEAVAAWRDTDYGTLAVVDTGEAYQKLQETVALAAGFLVEISFTLKQERRLVLDRARTIIDLVAELYSSVDDQLDFFINTNQLTGSEILELPKGREIVFYI